MINVGMVGLGFMGVTHLKAYAKVQGARIAAVCDAIKLPNADGTLGGVAGNIGTDQGTQLDMSRVKAYKQVEELLANPEVDLVDLCVPTSDHVRLSALALQAGKHVLCEKPLARRAAQAQEIVAASKSAKGYFMPAMCMRFWPEWAWLKKVMAENTYGKVLAARFRRVSPPPGWGQAAYFKGSDSGGALIDLHIHDTDFVQFLFGRPQRVVSTGLTRFSGAYDHVVTQYYVESGASVYAEATWLMSPGIGFNMAYTVHFEKATADYDLSRGANPLLVAENDQPARPVPCEGVDGYVGELQHMVDSIRAGHPPSIVTAQDGLSAVEICEAEEESIRTGQIISI